MDLQALIDEITELVVQQIGTVSSSAAPGGPDVLVVMGEGERGAESLSVQLRAVAALGSVTLVPSSVWPQERLPGPAHVPVRVVAPPASWGRLVEASRAIVVPNLALGELAAVSVLLGLTPASAAIVAGLIEGRPVLAGNDDINFLTVNAARLPKGVLDVVRTHVASVAAMGLRLVEGQRLADELALLHGAASTAPASTQRGRNVLTRDDVEVMLRGGARSIEVASGTIVTPLAQEVARAAGVEILIR